VASDERPEVATNGSRIEIESKVGFHTQQPFVVLRWGQESGQLTPTEARHHARRVLEAAEAADADAFLWGFLHVRVGMDDQGSGEVLGEFRRWRAKRDPEIEIEAAGTAPAAEPLAGTHVEGTPEAGDVR
jgi:hypothetical protein